MDHINTAASPLSWWNAPLTWETSKEIDLRIVVVAAAALTALTFLVLTIYQKRTKIPDLTLKTNKLTSKIKKIKEDLESLTGKKDHDSRQAQFKQDLEILSGKRNINSYNAATLEDYCKNITVKHLRFVEVSDYVYTVGRANESRRLPDSISNVLTREANWYYGGRLLPNPMAAYDCLKERFGYDIALHTLNICHTATWVKPVSFLELGAKWVETNNIAVKDDKIQLTTLIKVFSEEPGDEPLDWMIRTVSFNPTDLDRSDGKIPSFFLKLLFKKPECLSPDE